MADLIRDLDLPHRLRDVGIRRDDLRDIAKKVIMSPNIIYNPRPVTDPEEVLAVLERAWLGGPYAQCTEGGPIAAPVGRRAGAEDHERRTFHGHKQVPEEALFGAVEGGGQYMNDPHVESLVYRIRHDREVYYGGSEPAAYERQAFDIQIADKEVRFTMRAHFATEDAARQAVESFIRSWEFETALRQGRNAFTLVFKNAHIIDRKPDPPDSGRRDWTRPALQVSATFDGGLDGTLGAEVQLQSSLPYPRPPSNNVEVTFTVQQMWDRYLDFLEGKERLPALAYFCLTCLEGCAGTRKKVPAKFRIDKKVLSRIGCLTDRRGGVQARKAKGLSDELTDDEESFLKAAVPEMIRRMAQVAYDPNAEFSMIGLSNLPSM